MQEQVRADELARYTKFIQDEIEVGSPTGNLLDQLRYLASKVGNCGDCSGSGEVLEVYDYDIKSGNMSLFAQEDELVILLADTISGNRKHSSQFNQQFN